ncbi:hypothetical protein PAN31117_02349 [Pandoraea anapnoica]|uniref:Uncharacterized protein n=1 Tax=Pandoraea anapnoica TaxID=2508301 RepID=A0A5E5A075_9BURK|nr:hypothetical protein [Pandoraea anapnoica]VVE66676.1 hypothetical protein PAN31117_02349 [Pandoraea anapnoica]
MTQGGLSGRWSVCQKSWTKVCAGVPGAGVLDDAAVAGVADAVVVVSPLTQAWPDGGEGLKRGVGNKRGLLVVDKGVRTVPYYPV